MSEVLSYGNLRVALPPVVKGYLDEQGISVEPFASSVVLAFRQDGGAEPYRLRMLRPHFDVLLMAMCRMAGETFVQSAPRQDETP